MAHTKFLFFIDHHYAKIFKLHFFAKQAMCADDDIDLSFFQLFQRFFFSFADRKRLT